MNGLPPCESREEFADGGNYVRCVHPKVRSRDSVVSPAVCRTCGYAGGNPVTNRPLQRPRCDFRSDAAIAESDSFRCLHPCHDTVTLTDCESCIDHSAKLGQRTRPETWAVGVTTAPRRVTTLGQTLSSLQAAGWPEVSVFAEPGSPRQGLTADHRWSARSEKMGAFPNWYLSLTELVMRFPKADAYLMCQDDVVLSEGLRNYAEDTLWPSAAAHMVSFYCATANEQADTEGFVQLDAGWNMCGALALAFPNSVARALLCEPLFLHHRQNGPRQGLVSIDSVVGLWCRRSGVKFYVHQPTLVQHIGLHSTLWGRLNPSPRRSASSAPMDLSFRTHKSG